MSSAFCRVLVALLSALLLAQSTATAQTSELGWHGELARGTAAARESGKPLFVVFRCVR